MLWDVKNELASRGFGLIDQISFGCRYTVQAAREFDSSSKSIRWISFSSRRQHVPARKRWRSVSATATIARLCRVSTCEVDVVENMARCAARSCTTKAMSTAGRIHNLLQRNLM